MSYVPSSDTLHHMVWRKRNFLEDNTTPLFHYEMLDHYYRSGSYIKPIKAFRGSAKSTNTCYVALHRAENVDAHYTLIVSDTASQAEALIADISDMLRESNLRYKVIRDVAGEIELLVNDKRYFMVGKGAGASMRGIKRGRKRPDLIILDDIINDELVMNRLRIARLNRWFYKALLPSLDPGGEIYAVGTPLSEADLFMHLCSLHDTIEIPLKHGVWADRFSDKWIDDKKQEYVDAGMLRAFKQEFELVLTDDETQLFDVKKIDFIDEEDMPGDVTWYMACDLAISQKSGSDYSSFVCVGIDNVGKWYVYATQGHFKPSESAAKIIELQNRFSIYNVGIEQGATYLAVIEHLDSLMQDYQNYFFVQELKHGGIEKHARIKSLEPIINSGRLVIIDNGEDSETLMEQIELTDMEACNSKHDDCFSGDTLVVVNGSVMRFDEIPKEGVITGFNGKDVAYVNGGSRSRRNDLFSIELNDGRIIKSTANHEFLTVENGVFSWVKTINLKGHTLCEAKHLSAVEMNMMEPKEALTEINTVLTSAVQRREEIAELMTLTKSVSSAEQHLETTNTEQNLPVVVSVSLIEEKSLTYCVEVPSDRCFTLANGIVVSNCIDALAYLVRMVPRYYESIDKTLDGDVVHSDNDLPFELQE